MAMTLEHDPRTAESRDFHALHSHLSMAVPMAEQLCNRFPDDRALQRLCIHLYDALELMRQEPVDGEITRAAELFDSRHSSAA